MGFFGLGHWVESDEAADFRWVLLHALRKKSSPAQKQSVNRAVEKELDNMANSHNTPGFINLALCLEVEGMDKGNLDENFPNGLPEFSHLIRLEHLRRADRLFTREIPLWSSEFRRRLKNLHSVIQTAIKDRQADRKIMKAVPK